MIFGEVAEIGLLQLTANELSWETGTLGSNPSLSVCFLRQAKSKRHQSERSEATSRAASVVHAPYNFATSKKQTALYER